MLMRHITIDRRRATVFGALAAVRGAGLPAAD
jgi:hypothetical protein